MSAVRPLYLAMTYQDAADHGRLILRDGSSATLRLATAGDLESIRAFYKRLSPQSRRMRFFTESKPGDDVMLSLSDSSDPRRGMTLLVWRHDGGERRIIATGSYIAHDDTTAEFAVAVDDAFHGKGIGGLLFERLSVLAAAHGFSRFNAYTHVNNKSMLDVFRSSGFQLREQFQDGMVEVTLSLTPGPESESYTQRRDRLFTKASIRPLFQPRAIAVIGASRNPEHVGHRLFINLLRNQFKGVVYPVNPNATQISGVKAYARVEDLPESVDLAIIATPRQDVPAAVSACAQNGVRALIVVSSGYAESGEEGARLQHELVDKVRGYGMRLLGPNCLGVINTDPECLLNASLFPGKPVRGKAALSSQSGALGMALLQMAGRRNIGLSTFISMGNKADITGNDLLYYWEDDPNTEVILLYLESFGNPRRFGRIAREVSRRKPIVCVKSGKRRDVPEEQMVEALFLQTGVVRVQTLEEMFDVAAIFGSQPMPRGRNVHIVTNSRGAGVMGEDACTGHGLNVTALKDLSSDAKPGDYQQAVAASARNPEADIIMVMHAPITPVSDQPVFDAVSAAIRESSPDKARVLVVMVMMQAEAGGSVMTCRDTSFPVYPFPEKAANAVAAVARYREWRDAPAGFIPDYEDVDLHSLRKILDAPKNIEGGGWLNRDRTHELLDQLGLRMTREANPYIYLFEIKVEQHGMFGSVIALNFAGYTGNAPGKTANRMTPLTDRDAWSLIESALDLPNNGRAPNDESVDWTALHEMILRVSFLVEEFHEIEQVQISPVYVYRKGQGCAAGKARIRKTSP
ncbi:MAG TPA: GNAT family N-acetyltransferase [Kiritimatiellia bacterium]|nr:GNAT family N-acetyltransferase [Kiritimatiellia bacterium]